MIYVLVLGVLLTTGAQASPDLDRQAVNAVYKKDREPLQRVLDQGASPDAADSYGMTLLMLAAKRGRADLAALLLERGASPERTADGRTALYYAAAGGADAIVRMLLERGMDVNQTDGDGSTSLIAAAGFCNASTIEILLDAGADPTVKDRGPFGGSTALQTAEELFGVTSGEKNERCRLSVERLRAALK